MATEKRFLLNVNSKKIHDLERIDGRCKIKSMREDYMVYFDSLEEALAYPSPQEPLAKPCTFCVKQSDNTNGEERRK